MPKKAWGSEEEEREYWRTADTSRAARKAEQAGALFVTTLYVDKSQHAAMAKLAKLMHEKAATLYRRAITEFLRREAKKNGTTLQQLLEQTR